MSKQVAKKVTRTKSKKKKEQPVGYYKEGGKTKPITKAKGLKKKTRIVTKVVEGDAYIPKSVYEGGRKATLSITMEDENGEEFSIDSTDVRWETIKPEKLVKTQAYTDDGKKVGKKYIGPKKRLAWVDEDGDERGADEVQLKQVHEDGSLTDIDAFEATKEIEAEARPKDLMDAFLPDSLLEVWGDSTETQAELQELARKLYLTGQVAAVRQFAKSKGTKVYVGFIKPVFDPEDDDVWGLEMMVSQSRLKRRRWMPVDDIPIVDESKKATKKKTGKTADVPDVF